MRQTIAMRFGINILVNKRLKCWLLKNHLWNYPLWSCVVVDAVVVDDVVVGCGSDDGIVGCGVVLWQ